MNLRIHKLLRPICALLVLAVALPPVPVLAQGAGQSGSSGSGSTGSLLGPTSSRVGGSSFGTKSRTGSEMQRAPNAATQHGAIIQGPSYQVHILGEVAFPGTYRVPASTRLSEAVQLAGGILERGSQRHVQLRRKGQKTKNVDLLAFKVLGSLDNNPYLLDNDVVFVPLKKKVVQISGAVKRPDFYEMSSRANLRDAIRLAGGFSSGVAFSQPAKIIRFEGEEKTLIDVPLEKSDLKNFRLKRGDVVVIPHILTKENVFDYNTPTIPGDSDLFYPSFEERVFVIGAVQKPGPYPFSPYYTIREYLTIAGGFTRLAKKKKVHVISTTGKKTKAGIETEINPGDTIVIPEKYMAPESVATLILSLTATALTITTTVLALTR